MCDKTGFISQEDVKNCMFLCCVVLQMGKFCTFEHLCLLRMIEKDDFLY